jgi:uncharacterized protein (DUF736 family)
MKIKSQRSEAGGCWSWQYREAGRYLSNQLSMYQLAVSISGNIHENNVEEDGD